MFTGLIEACVPVRRSAPRGTGLRLWVERPPGFDPDLGSSIAVSGACLTVIGAADPESGHEVGLEAPGADLVFDLSAETLARTWFEELAPGRRVNLERALRIGERLDGHLVQGHVDGQGRILALTDVGDGGRRARFEVEPALARYLVDKGSIALDGISLTLVRPTGATFEVALIPATLAGTTLGSARVGDRVNVESDPIGKWVERLIGARGVDRA